MNNDQTASLFPSLFKNSKNKGVTFSPCLLEFDFLFRQSITMGEYQSYRVVSIGCSTEIKKNSFKCEKINGLIYKINTGFYIKYLTTHSIYIWR